MYLGNKEIDQIKKDKKFVRVTFKEIGGEQPKPLLTSQEFIDFCKTEKFEENAETKFKEKRMNFYAKIILDIMSKTDFFNDLSKLCKTKDQDIIRISRVNIVQSISDELLIHNIPLEDWHDAINQAVGLINQQANSIKSWLEETFLINTSQALKNLFKEGDYDMRTFNDVHILQ
jgi:hypothetical protein